MIQTIRIGAGSDVGLHHQMNNPKLFFVEIKRNIFKQNLIAK